MRLRILSILFPVLAFLDSAYCASPPQRDDRIDQTIVANDEARDLAVLMGDESVLINSFTSNRSSLITILAGTFHITQDKAAVACDKVVMPALIAHAPDLLSAEANALRARFNETEIKAMIKIYQQPVMRKLVGAQVELRSQIADFAQATFSNMSREMFEKHSDELHQLGIDRQ